MTLGERIQSHRKRLGLSQEQLAEQLGVSRQAVSKWELNDAQPDVDKIIAMGRVFGITTDALLCGEEDQEQEEDRQEMTPPGEGAVHPRKKWYLLGIVPLVLGAVLLGRGILSAVTVAAFLHSVNHLVPSGGDFSGWFSDAEGLGQIHHAESRWAAAVYVPVIAECVAGAVLLLAGILVLVLGRKRWKKAA